MILHLIQSYIESKQTVLNNFLGSSVQLKQIQTELDLDSIGNSESFIHYQLYVTGIESLEYEARNFSDVNIKIEFVFLVANKKYTIYKKIFDRYVFGIARILKFDDTFPSQDTDISNALTMHEIKNVNITNADRFENDSYLPSIEFTMMISDAIDISQSILKSESV